MQPKLMLFTNNLRLCRRTSVEGADAAGSHSGAAQLLPLHLQSCAGNAYVMHASQLQVIKIDQK